MGDKCSPGRHKALELGRLIGGRTVGRAEVAILFAGFGWMNRIDKTQSFNSSDKDG